jgi:hypothetical protein
MEIIRNGIITESYRILYSIDSLYEWLLSKSALWGFVRGNYNSVS